MPVKVGVLLRDVSVSTVGTVMAVAVVLLPAASVADAVILAYLVKPPWGTAPLEGVALAVATDQDPALTAAW